MNIPDYKPSSHSYWKDMPSSLIRNVQLILFEHDQRDILGLRYLTGQKSAAQTVDCMAFYF